MRKAAPFALNVKLIQHVITSRPGLVLQASNPIKPPAARVCLPGCFPVRSHNWKFSRSVLITVWSPAQCDVVGHVNQDLRVLQWTNNEGVQISFS